MQTKSAQVQTLVPSERRFLDGWRAAGTGLEQSFPKETSKEGNWENSLEEAQRRDRTGEHHILPHFNGTWRGL